MFNNNNCENNYFNLISDTYKNNNIDLESYNNENNSTKNETNSPNEQNNNINSYEEKIESLNNQSNDNSDEQSQPFKVLYYEEEIKKHNPNVNFNKINNEQDENYNQESEKKNEKINNSNIQININIDKNYIYNNNNENFNLKTESSIIEKTFNEQKNNSNLKFYPLKKSEDNDNQSNHNNEEKNENIFLAKKEYLFKKMFTLITEILIEKLNKKLKKVKLISEYNYDNYKSCLNKKIKELLITKGKNEKIEKNENIEKKINLLETEQNFKEILNMELNDFINKNKKALNEKYKKFFNNYFLIYFKPTILFEDLNSIEKLINEININKGNKKIKRFKKNNL